MARTQALNDRLKAFKSIIPAWQEASNRSASGLQAMSYHTEIGAGRCTYSKSTSIVRPCFSDLVADVQLNANRVLNTEQLAYFNLHYRDNCMDIDAVPAHMKKFDDVLREKLGRRLVEVGLYPLTLYMRGVDVRDRKRAA